MIRTAFLVLLFLLSLQSHAQEWVAQYQNAQTAYSNDNLELAYKEAQKSLKGYLEADGSLSANYASILRLLATITYSSGIYEKGIEHAKKEIQVRQSIGEDNNLEYATSLYNLGSFQEALNQPEQALETFKEALPIYKQYYQPDHESIINCKWKIASSLVTLNNNEEAYLIYQETVGPAEEQPAITMEYVNACNDYTNILVEKKIYEEALQHLINLEDIYQQLGTGFEPALMQVYLNKGISLHGSGDYDAAEEAYAKAHALLTDVEDDNLKSQLNNLRAINYQSMGQTEKANALLGEINTSGDALSQATALNNQAILKQNNGEIEAAKELLSKAVALLSDSATNYKNAKAETLENLSVVYLIAGQTDSATITAKTALDIRTELNQPKEKIALARYKLAEAKHAADQWQEALTNYEFAANAWLNKDPNRYANVIGSMAIYFQDRGDYLKAEQLFKDQLALLKSNDTNNLAYATALNNIATLNQIQADYLTARAQLEQALSIVKSINGESSLNFAGIAENLALVNMQLGAYQQAEQLLSVSLSSREKILGKQHPLYATTLQNLGRLKQLKGKYQEAEPLYSQAMQIKKSTLGENSPQYAYAVNNMALLYQTMGNFNRAEPLFQQTIKIYEAAYGKRHPEYATALENLATLTKLKGNTEKAAQLLEEALAIDEEILGKNHPRYATTLHNLASIYKDLKKYEEAASLFQQALIIDKKVYGENHPAYASTTYNLAVLQQELGKIDSAEINFKKALSIREKVLGANHPDYAYSLYGLAGLYHLTKEYGLAKSYYDRVIASYLKQIDEFFPSLSEKEKSAFYGKIKPVIESFQDFSIEYATSDIDSAAFIIGDMYDLQLATKALLLHASNKVRNRIFNSGNQELVDSYQRWTEMKEQLSRYLSFSQEELQEKDIDLTKLDNQINDLEKYLSQQSEIFAEEVEQDRISWTQIQQQLTETDAALEIIRIKKRYVEDSIMYVGLVLRKGMQTPELVILNEGNHLEDRYFNYYRNAIKFTVGDNISYEQFWAPIDAKLENIQTVYASADGVFNKININTLYDEKYDKYVIDEYNVRLVSNTKEILKANAAEQKSSENFAAVFGFPDFNQGVSGEVAVGNTRASQFGFSDLIPELPGTKTEVEKLNALLTENDWQTELFTYQQAGETEIKQIKGPKLLHVATHGFFMQDIDFEEDTDYGAYFNDQDYNPLFRSGLLLAGAASSIYKDTKLGEEDGILTAYEAMNLNLDETSLVVLSACETGIGEVKNGEGVYGLQRSFIVAGAESLIMSLWQVDDTTTQELMVLFYTNWLSGQSKYEAFKNASKTLKEKFEDPFHWGAFVILGVE